MTSWDKQPPFFLGSFRIDEPVTTLTDLLVSAVCFYAYWQLKKQNNPGRVQLYFRAYFVLMGAATLLGGLAGHGFLYALGFSWKLPGWIISMLSVAMIERSSIERARQLTGSQVSRFFLGLNIVELLTVMTVTIVSLDFKWVEFHSGYGLLGVVLPFQTYTWLKTKDPGSLMVIIAVGVASIAALIFMNKISMGIWFNHLDISHIFMAIAAYIFYRGANLLRQ